MLVVAALTLGATLVPTRGEPPPPSPPSAGVNSTNQLLVPSKPTPIFLDKLPSNQPLQPGVYQTYPWTTILVVPGRGIDDGIFAVKPNTNSIMPIVKPHVEVIPKSQPKP